MICQRASMISDEINDLREDQWYRMKINDMPKSIHDIGRKLTDESQWSPKELMISDLNKCAWGLVTLSVMPQNPFLLIIWLILGQVGYYCTRPRRNTIISVPIASIGNIHYRRLRTVIPQKPTSETTDQNPTTKRRWEARDNVSRLQTCDLKQ